MILKRIRFFISGLLQPVFIAIEAISSVIEDMLIRKSGRKIVHILHIRKTGGTAIKEALRNNLDTDKYKIKLHRHGFALKHIPKGTRYCFFLRDPLDMFVSGFNGRKRQGRPRYNIPWRRGEKRAFSVFNTANDLAESLSSSDSNMKKEAVFAMNKIAHLRSSYWHWFSNKEYFLLRLSDILFIGFQNNLAHDFERLKKLLHVPEHVKLPSDDIRSHRGPDDQDKYLSDQAKNNLYEWYKKDFEFYELAKELAERVNK